MRNLIPIEHKNQRVLTSTQLAEGYEATVEKIKQNFNNNKDRYSQGIHYYILEGEELSQFKNLVENFDLVNNRTPRLYLWTEKGALLHAKSLNTDKAWEVYGELVENYFRVKENPLPVQIDSKFLFNIAAQLEEKENQNQALQLENKVQTQIINELKPKADYMDIILQNKDVMAITQISKDYGMSGQTMNKILHELGVQYKLRDQWLLYREYQSKGYTHSETVQIVRWDGSLGIKVSTKWTQKGRLFIYKLLKEKRNILPLIEKNMGA